MGKGGGIRRRLEEALAAVAAGELSVAVTRAEEVVAQSPELPVALHVLALVALRMEEPGRALELFARAHAGDPECREHVEAQAIVHARLGHLQESLYFIKLATTLTSGNVVEGLLPQWLGSFEDAFLSIREARYRYLGDQHLRAGNLNTAIDMYRRETEATPDDVKARRAYAWALSLAGRHQEALVVYAALLAGQQGDDTDRAAAAAAMIRAGEPERAEAVHAELLGRERLQPAILSRIVANNAALPDARAADIATAESVWAEIMAPRVPEATPHRVLEVGYFKVGIVSGRLTSLGNLDFLWPTLLNFDGTNLSLYFYKDTPFEDAITRRLLGLPGRSIDTGDVDTETLAEIIRNDGIHVLIDLDGHGESGRPELFLHRPAPVALRFAGIPESATAQGFDGVLGDRWLYPEGEEGAGDDAHDDAHDTGYVVRMEEGLFRLPARENLNLRATALPDRPGMIGLAPNAAAFDDSFRRFLKDLLQLDEGVRVLLSLDRLGGAACRGIVEGKLAQAGITERVDLYCNENIAITDEFVGQLDLMLNPGGDIWAPAALECLVRGLPVLVAEEALPARRLIHGLLGAEGLESFILADHPAMLKKLSGYYRTRTLYARDCARLKRALNAAMRKKTVRRSAGLFLKTLIGVYDRVTRHGPDMNRDAAHHEQRKET